MRPCLCASSAASPPRWFSINFVKEGDVSKVVCTGTQRILKLWDKLLIDAAYKPPGEKFEAWDGKIELKSFNLIKALKPVSERARPATCSTPHPPTTTPPGPHAPTHRNGAHRELCARAHAVGAPAQAHNQLEQ